ncbi:MAG: universal stress protein [Smithellaceae bacterium]
MEIKKIVFATDFSAGSNYTAHYAAEMARRYGAKLYVIHVIQDMGKMTAWYAPKVNMKELQKTMEEKSQQELQLCCTEGFGDLKNVEYRLLKGVPYEQILNFQQENKVDVIVIGTIGGHNTGKKNAFGSTADRVVKNARCPVLTVSLPAQEAAESYDPRLCSSGEIRF